MTTITNKDSGRIGTDARGMRFLVLDTRNVDGVSRDEDTYIAVLPDTKYSTPGACLHNSWAERPVVWADAIGDVCDIGFFRAGESVWFRGEHTETYSVRGVIEEVLPEVEGATIVGVYKYGVRLENGNYILCAPDQVRERGGE